MCHAMLNPFNSNALQGSLRVLVLDHFTGQWLLACQVILSYQSVIRGEQSCTATAEMYDTGHSGLAVLEVG